MFGSNRPVFFTEREREITREREERLGPGCIQLVPGCILNLAELALAAVVGASRRARLGKILFIIYFESWNPKIGGAVSRARRETARAGRVVCPVRTARAVGREAF